MAPGHIAGVFFQRETGTRFQFVPYRGAAPAIQDLVAGQIDMAITDPIAALPQVRAGTIKAYGVTTKTRLPSAPDIPTLDEAGLPGFDISQWHGLWLPKGTPKNIIAKLNAAVTDALAVNSGPKLAENQRFEIVARPHLAVDLLAANLSGTPCPVKAGAAEGGGQRPAFTGHGVPPNLAAGIDA